MKKRRNFSSRSLTQRLLTRVVITSAVVMLFAALVGFHYSYQRAMSAQITELQYDKKQRVEREATVFRQAEKTASLLGRYFLEAYTSDSPNVDWSARFDAMHEETEPGVFRLKEVFYTGTTVEAQRIRYLTSFIGRSSAALDDERKRRIALVVELLQRFGAGWQDFYDNTHVSMPENALVQYSRNQPWGRQAAADLDMTQYAVVRSTLQAFNPERAGRWTGLYYDLSSEQWVVTYQQPIDYEGVHLVTPSHDVQLADIFARLIDSESEQTEHAIINRSRQLIAASPTLLEGHQASGIIDLFTIDAPAYQAIWQRIEHKNGPTHFQLEAHGVLVVAEKIPGPEWWYVTSYPLAEVRKAALVVPLRFLLIGFGFAFILLAILYVFVSQQISRPLRELAGFAEAVGDNRYDELANIPIRDEYNKSEVGLLLRSMKDMSNRIVRHQAQLEQQVQERTSELADANHQLDKMAHIDGLTKLLNRRAFDRDLQVALEKSRQDEGVVYALLMTDVDYFKSYNDSYGHVAGDEALQRIATRLEALFLQHAYRFGGEEFACIVELTNHHQAPVEGERVRAAVEQLQIEHKDAPLGVLTMSVGWTLLSQHNNAAGAISCADEQLYQAKKHSRNCVCGPAI